MASETSQLGPSQAGSVLLDIGGSRGALVLMASADRVGEEVHISSNDVPSPRTHVAIRERRGPNTTSYAAIFPSLEAGEYTVWAADRQPAATIAIIGGQVSQMQWPIDSDPGS